MRSREKETIPWAPPPANVDIDFDGCMVVVGISFVLFLLLAVIVGGVILVNLALDEIVLWVVFLAARSWTFLITHPFIDALAIVAMIVAVNFLRNELSRPNRAVGAFDPAIIPLPWIRNQFPIAEVSKGWQLAFYAGWFVSFTAGISLALLSGAVNTVDFLFSDMVIAMCKLNPEFYKLVESQPWLGYLLLTIVFFSFMARSLQKTFWLAKCRSVAVRDDPRRKPLILLVDTIHGWNAQIPIFNDLAESGEHEEEMQSLLLKRAQLIDLMNRMEKRLAVAPLGSFPENSNVSELPEFKELNTLVEDLKREPCTRDAWKDARKEVMALGRFFTGA